MEMVRIDCVQKPLAGSQSYSLMIVIVNLHQIDVGRNSEVGKGKYGMRGGKVPDLSVRDLPPFERD